jgi:hypothetical protein
MGGIRGESLGGDAAGEDEARRAVSRELGSLRRGAGLTEDVLRDATALLALDAVKRAAAARRVEAWNAAGYWLGSGSIGLIQMSISRRS